MLSVCLLLVPGCQAKNVLIVSAPAISHMRELNAIGEELELLGHDVYQVPSNVRVQTTVRYKL